tara:strand:+ start:1596 stop:1844 length:249 start_codon:yes stop_codon:yes gene_type:complete
LHEVDSDPLLPRCFIQHVESHREAKEWVVDSIRKLKPSWWQAASARYDKIFYDVGVYHPIKEINQRRRNANLWLLKTVKDFT